MKYQLMHRTLPVATIMVNDVSGTIYKVEDVEAAAHLPVGVIMQKPKPLAAALNEWLSGRAIPASRSGFRHAMQTVAMERNIELSPTKLLMHCYGLSLSDQYWLNPVNAPLNWEKINFYDNAFSADVGDILFGRIPTSKKLDLVSPCNASDGWLRKKWKIVDGARVLVKGGSGVYHQEPFNEVVAANVCARLGIPFVPYSIIWENNEPFSACPDMTTNRQDLVNAYSIYHSAPYDEHISPYEHFLRRCNELGIEDAKKHIGQMLILDFLVANTDRHMGNFGAIRDAITLEWKGIAPIYDTGSSMWYETVTGRINGQADTPAKPFCSRHKAQLALALEELPALDLSQLSGIGELCEQLYGTADFGDEQRASTLATALTQRCEYLQALSLEQCPRKIALGKSRVTSICTAAKAKATTLNGDNLSHTPAHEQEQS